MKIQMIRAYRGRATKEQLWDVGSEHEVSAKLADYFIGHNHAVDITPKPKTTPKSQVIVADDSGESSEEKPTDSIPKRTRKPRRKTSE